MEKRSWVVGHQSSDGRSLTSVSRLTEEGAIAYYPNYKLSKSTILVETHPEQPLWNLPSRLMHKPSKP